MNEVVIVHEVYGAGTDVLVNGGKIPGRVVAVNIRDHCIKYEIGYYREDAYVEVWFPAREVSPSTEADSKRIMFHVVEKGN
jgi:hypothetical protein